MDHLFSFLNIKFLTSCKLRSVITKCRFEIRDGPEGVLLTKLYWPPNGFSFLKSPYEIWCSHSSRHEEYFSFLNIKFLTSCKLRSVITKCRFEIHDGPEGVLLTKLYWPPNGFSFLKSPNEIWCSHSSGHEEYYLLACLLCLLLDIKMDAVHYSEKAVNVC
jgi:hypothetical protein